MTDPIKILETHFIQMIDLETLHIIEIETFPTIGIETIQSIGIINVKIIDHAIILTTDQTIKDQNIIIIKIDHERIHRTKIRVIKTDKETTLNHHIGITHVLKIYNKNIEVVHLNIKCKSIEYQQLKKLNQTPTGTDITESTELQIKNKKWETTDSESDADKAISVNMIHVENDYKPNIYEQPIHSHIYQNHDHFLLNYFTRPISSNPVNNLSSYCFCFTSY